MLGQRIKEARTALGLSQEALAKGICSRPYISGIETGKIRPTAENLQAIANRLGKPMSYFLPDEKEDLAQRIKALLNQAKVHLAADDVTHAQALFEECQGLYNRSLPPEIIGLYREVLAELQRKSGAVLESAVSAMTAAEAYQNTGCTLKAWDCKYSAAFGLYKSGHIKYAISLALDALKIIAGEPELIEQLRRTHYLLGCGYAALGNSAGAQEHFAMAEKEAGPVATDMGIKGLIARASCYGRQGDWASALEVSQRAVEQSDKSRLAKLKAEALIGACVCLARLKETQKVETLLAEIIGMPELPTAIKRKAYREVILALCDVGLITACVKYEQNLEQLIKTYPSVSVNWEGMKDEWALVKCRQFRNPQGVKEQVLSFSQRFIAENRNRDAADVLTFGAEQLRKLDQAEEAYSLLKQAYELLKK